MARSTTESALRGAPTARYERGRRSGRTRERTLLRGIALAAVVMLVAAVSAPAAAEPGVVLADPAAPLAETWDHRVFGAATSYSQVRMDGVVCIRAQGRASASGLYRAVNYRVAVHPWLEWRWRVDALQGAADIRVKEREDFAAAIFLIFGRPGLLSRDAPTPAYVWTNERVARDSIVVSPRFPAQMRSVVVENGSGRLGSWRTERRNVVADFKRAFGRDPPEVVELIAIFTDNDNTGEPVEAYYGAIAARAQ